MKKTRPLFPSPLVGEGGAKRRMRGLCPRREPLIRLRFANAPSPTRGEGKNASPLKQKGPGRNRGLMSQTDKLSAYLSRFLSPVQRISPSVAPESHEPYCALASISSPPPSAVTEGCTSAAVS